MTHATTKQKPLNEMVSILSNAAQTAAIEIMRQFNGTRCAEKKSDNSPVTEADMAAHRIICQQLTAAFPDIARVSEEDAEHLQPAADLFFAIDPLDGTRAFVRGDMEFTVNIGLIKGGYPILGVMAVPASGALYWGGEGIGAWRDDGQGATPIHCRPIPTRAAVIACSQSHPSQADQTWINQHETPVMRAASSAIKFLWVAEGSADYYPRFGRTMEWDSAAGQAIVEAAGGSVTTPQGARFSYGKPDYANGAFIVAGAPQ